MTTDTENPIDEEKPVDAEGVETTEAEEGQEVDVNSPEYQSFESSDTNGQANDLARLQNIQIAVTAELGRATIPIQELMKLAEGSIVELDRAIDSPVDLIAQGVTLASGEVVVVDGSFAIRILHVNDNSQ